MTPGSLPDLPGPLAEPLHLLEATWSLWPWLLFVLVNSLLFAWLRHRYRKFKAKRALGRASKPPSSKPFTPRPAITEIEHRIEQLRKKHREPAAAREGCHQLSELLRDHLAGSLAPHQRPAEPDSLTGREVGWLFGGAVDSFFLLLTSLEFGRRQPHPSELETACDLAVEVARSEPRPKPLRSGRRGGDGQSAEAVS